MPDPLPDNAPITHPFETAPEPGEVIEIAPGILWARIPLPIRLNHVNVYILDDGDSWTVVDTGLSRTLCRQAWDALLRGPLAGKPVRRVIGTHHHFDHIGLAGWFQEQGAELWMTRTAWLFARMLYLDSPDAFPEESVDFARSAGMPEDVLQRRIEEGPFLTSRSVYPMPLGFMRIVDGDVITTGGRDWVVRTGDGHAPEQATLWCRDEPIVLGADQLLPGISPNISVYATMPVEDPLRGWLDSCERLKEFASDDQLVLPGHKLPFRGLPRRLNQLIENHHSALERVEAHLSEPRTAVECFPPLFMRTIEDSAFGLAMGEAMAHCVYLWRRGKVTRTVTKEGAWLWQAKA